MILFARIVVLLLLASGAYCKPLPLIGTNTEIADHWYLLADQNPELTYFDVVELPDASWQRIDNEGASLGQVKEPLWLKLDIRNLQTNEHWYLVLNNRGIQKLDIWQADANGIVINRKTLGAILPYDEGRSLKIPKLNFAFTQPPVEMTTLFVRVEHQGYLDLNGVIISTEEAITQIRREAIMEWLFYGIYIAFLMYHTVLFISGRERSHLGYVLFLGTIFLFFAFVEGYLFSLFSNRPAWGYSLGHASVALISVMASVFTLLYLDIRQSRWRYIFYVIIGFGTTLAILRLLSNQVPALTIGSATALITFAIIPAASLHQHFRRQVPFALAFFAAWSVWSVMAIVIAFSALGFLTFDISGFWTSLKIAFAIQNIMLSWSLGVRIRALANASASAQAESAAKSALISQVSHEIRTPMNGIIGTSQLLEAHIKDDEGHELNEVIYHSGIALLTVINDLLDLSRLEAGKIEVKPEPTDIQKLTQQVFSTLHAQLKLKELTHTIEVSEQLPDALMLDSVRLRQVLLNLIGNAIKYTDQGSITVRLQFKHPQLSIEVIDTGRGIPEDRIEGLFEPFVQVRDDAQEQRSGTGLGLHIARSLTQLMEGSIHITSKVGEGTKIRLLLPTRQTSAVERQLAQDRMHHPETSKPLMVLIADDNPVNQRVLTGLLSKAGHEVAVVDNGFNAVSEYFEYHEKFDLVMMDCEMPGMDGYEATTKIREIEAAKHLPAVPILAVTAHAFEGHMQKVTDAGMDGQLNKPITKESLAQALLAIYT